MNDQRKILLALVVVIVILLLLKHITKSAAAEKRSVAMRAMAAEADADLVFDPLTPPTHMPIYETAIDDLGRVKYIANYTSVPVCVKNMQIMYEPDQLNVVDKKIPATATGRLEQRSDLDPLEASIVQQEQAKDAVKQALLFDENGAVKQLSSKYSGDHDFICSLNVNNECKDFQGELCKQWASNNECLINPEFMLENCPNACRACGMSAGERNVLINIYNSRDPINCVYHHGYRINGTDGMFE